jgi:Lar family restriction alleviation protein
MSELKKCPFCGGEGEFHVNTTSNHLIGMGWSFSIRCKNCKLEFPKMYGLIVELSEDGEIVTVADGRADAINDWNRRAGC